MAEAILSDEIEIWKPVVGYEGIYECSNLGRILANRKNILLKPILGDGQPRFTLTKNKQSKQITLSAILNQAFPETKKPAQCHWCNGVFSPAKYLQYCSDHCRTESTKKLKRESFLKGYSVGKYKNVYVPKQPIERTAICIYCSVEFNYTRFRQQYHCSWECKASTTAKKLKELRDMRPERILTCSHCSCQFSAPVKRGGKKYCSDICRRAVYKQWVNDSRRAGTLPRSKPRKRAQFYGVKYEHVNPFDVFVKYKWQCAQCKCILDPKLRGTSHEQAPEIDHIIPISKGGHHVSNNLQALCRTCNIVKSDKI